MGKRRGRLDDHAAVVGGPGQLLAHEESQRDRVGEEVNGEESGRKVEDLGVARVGAEIPLHRKAHVFLLRREPYCIL